MKYCAYFFVIIILLFSLSNNALCSYGKYWIFFKDKPQYNSQETPALSKRALIRRAKTLAATTITDHYDVPISPAYLERLDRMGIEPIQQSRWLNSVSAHLTTAQITLLKSQSWIIDVRPVQQFHPYPVKTVAPSATKLSASQTLEDEYGSSLNQNYQIRVTDAHQMGITGLDVLIGVLDTGFRYKQHEAFARLKVIAEYDFINKDSNTDNQESNNDISSQRNHGTNVLSVLGGYKYGKLIGPAYDAQFLLAKTEDDRSETIAEEDYWVAGLEWMEAQGVDVVSSSLGYNDWYQYSDMDGNTAITTKAADIAARKGVVVVNSMGNERSNSWKYMIAPADGDSVISVGGVNSSGQLNSFSSRGPTFDGRIKPDVVAMGSGVYAARASGDADYSFVQGTSFSAPLVAGVAGLILSAHPELTPMQVRDALRKTASRADDPNNDYGWGIVNAVEALYYHGLFFSNLPEIEKGNNRYTIKTNIFSKLNIPEDSVRFYYSFDENKYNSVQMQKTDIDHQYQTIIPTPKGNFVLSFYITATDESGARKTHPYDAPSSHFSFQSDDTTVTPPDNDTTHPEKFVLYANYPNPFNSKTTIKYELYQPNSVTLSMYNISGQLVKTIVNEFQTANTYLFHWNGTNNNGLPVTSGVYIFSLNVGTFHETQKLLLLR
ncbi:S8 family serine peptidase [candidate division KSB1 bacterium]|nr:S8 family serine peptidase [candidate division KSB1 bacterium]